MARVIQTTKNKGGKEIKCGRAGCGAVIQPGEKYYHWTPFRSAKRVRCHLHPPRPSETCTNKLAGAYAANEGVEDTIAALRAGKGSLSELSAELESAADAIDEVKDEYQEGLDNMPDGLRDSQSETQDKIDQLASYAETLRGAASDIEGLDTTPDEGETESDKESEINDEACDIADDALGEFSL